MNSTNQVGEDIEVRYKETYSFKPQLVSDPSIAASSKYRMEVHNPAALAEKVSEMKREKEKKMDQAMYVTSCCTYIG